MDEPRPPRPPEDALRDLLPPDVDLDAGWRHAAGVVVWHGIVWGRLGRGDLAAAHLDRVRVPELWPWIAAERGALARELGEHAAAERLEFSALVRVDDPVDDAMLRISLAADAVGLGDLGRAERRAAAAATVVAGLDDGPRAARQRLRLTWVGAEVAFLAGRRPGDDVVAQLPRWDPAVDAPAWPVDHDHGSRFHRAKGALFGGVVHGDARLVETAAALAPPALAWAVHLARADLGAAAAGDAARRAWADVTPPPDLAAAVASGATARRVAAA